jgi:type VI secretion system protein ImpC
MSEQPQPPDIDVDLSYPEGLKVTADAPYRLLLVADFAGSDEAGLSGSLADGMVEANAEKFDAVMAAAAPTLEFSIVDPVGGKQNVPLRLVFKSLADFGPQAVAKSIPPAARLFELREKIVARLQGNLDADGLSAQAAALCESDAGLSWAIDMLRQPTKPARNDAADSVLDQLDLGDDSASGAADGGGKQSDIGAAVSAAAGAGGSIPPEEASKLRRLLGETDRRLSAWLTAVVTTPQYRALERSWRSLHWLIRRMEFRKGLRLNVLHARLGDLAERFVEHVIDPVFDEGYPAPQVAAFDYQFGSTARDYELLDEIAQHAASIPAVALAGVGAGFFGVKHAWQIPTLPPVISLFDQWQFAKWKTLRSQPYARNLGVVFGRLLLRPPFGRDDERQFEFIYREPAVGERDFIWATGAVAGACTIAQSVAASGWPCAMAGRYGGRIDGLPQASGGKNGDKTFGPTDTETPQSRIEEMGMVGINAITNSPDAPDAIFWNGLSAARLTGGDANAMLEISLPYQLFAGRISSLLFDLKPTLVRRSSEEVISIATSHIANWLGVDGDNVAEHVVVQTQPTEDKPDVLMMAATITPPESILPAGIPVVMGYRLE